MRFTVYIPWDVFWMVPLIWVVLGLVLFPVMWWMSENLIHRAPGEKMNKPGWRPVAKGLLVWPILVPALVYENIRQVQRKRERKRVC